MRILLIVFCVIIFIIQCNSKSQNQTKFNNQENQTDYQNFKSQLIGVWGEQGEENALFQISNDSIYYFDHMDNPLAYELKEGVLAINYSGQILKNKIVKLNSDTLQFINPSGEHIKLYKRK
ncbi:hypothetical protein HZR84_00810 [Hyphobacterium sp. CCMP332]|nr:hypothetical protein HZR84_00810 [Hyphobacterium sp. CCMP332]